MNPLTKSCLCSKYIWDLCFVHIKALIVLSVVSYLSFCLANTTMHINTFLLNLAYFNLTCASHSITVLENADPEVAEVVKELPQSLRGCSAVQAPCCSFRNLFLSLSNQNRAFVINEAREQLSSILVPTPECTFINFQLVSSCARGLFLIQARLLREWKALPFLKLDARGRTHCFTLWRGNCCGEWGLRETWQLFFPFWNPRQVCCEPAGSNCLPHMFACISLLRCQS